MDDKLIEAIKTTLAKYGVNDEELQKSFIGDLEAEVSGESPQGEKQGEEIKKDEQPEVKEPNGKDEKKDDKTDGKDPYDMWKKQIGMTY